MQIGLDQKEHVLNEAKAETLCILTWFKIIDINKFVIRHME